MKTIKAVYVLPLAAAGISTCTEINARDHRPNIIFIMTDDHTSQAMSCYGSQLIETPNMDRLAEEGMRFDACYATNALSGPSRACILTGKLGHMNGFIDNSSTFDASQQTFPKLMQKAGYRTGIVGKWHLISTPEGFDHWSILTGQKEQGDYYNPEFMENGVPVTEEGYVTDIITQKAISFIDGALDENIPFMLMCHHKAPHRNWMPSPRHLGMFNDTVFPEPPTLFDDYSGRGEAAKSQDMSIEHTLTGDWDLKLLTRDEILTGKNKLYDVYTRMPEEVQHIWDSVYAHRIQEYRSGNLEGKELVSWKYQQYMRDYLATLASVDENIGTLLDFLESIGELDDTIIIYTSDQGFFLGEHGWFDKRFMYDECLQMPLLIRYPKSISPGTTTSAIAMNIDFAPTFLDYAGIEIPSDIQGKSLRPILENKGIEPEGWRQATYYHYYEYPAEHSVKRHYGIRTKDFKLIHFYNDIDEWEMYDLVKDPREMFNIHEDPAYKDKREEMHGILEQIQKEYKDTDPCGQEKRLNDIIIQPQRKYLSE